MTEQLYVRRHLPLFLALAIGLLACGKSSQSEKTEPPAETPPAFAWDDTTRAAALEAGAAVITKHECRRCHEIDALPAAARPDDCVSCHIFIKGLAPGQEKKLYERIAAKNGKDVLDRYIRNIEHFRTIPSLTGIAKRVRPRWIEEYLRSPHDLRPMLDESMIRNKLTGDEIRALVRYFAASADVADPYAPGVKAAALPPRPPPPLIKQGRDKFQASACGTCHTFGNVDFGVDAATLAKNPASALAPNLRFVAQRTRPEVLVDWIFQPGAIKPDTVMPKMVASREDAELIAGYLLYGDPGELEAPAAPETLMKLPPVLDRKVTYEEMKEEVLGFVCVHCHMNDHEKDQGPGNLGGLGFAGLKLSFRTYERLVWGAEGPDGKRYSVLETLPGEEMPRVLSTMLRRKVENRRDYQQPFHDSELPDWGDGLLGMPMGLPALSDDKIALLRTWIEQGCVGPAGVTGRKEFGDGFLVPDGPIAKNKGCELRAPAEKRPKWAYVPLPAETEPKKK